VVLVAVADIMAAAAAHGKAAAAVLVIQLDLAPYIPQDTAQAMVN
jgi:hypothetical protein